MAANAILCYHILMFLKWNPSRAQHFTGWMALTLGIMFLALMGYGFLESESGTEEQLAARLLPAHMRGQVEWKTISEEDMERGATVPAHVNVIFHLPIDMERITRKVLLGPSGKTVRYWGYCFPEDIGIGEDTHAKWGLPGKIFLSEMEQTKVQERLQEEERARFTTPRGFTEETFEEARSIRGIIRHEKEVFEAGETCYLMTEEVLPIGVDNDKDGVNSRVETEHKTLPYDADSDDDGILDGLEIYGLKTSPLMRDTDGDGIIDGVEDANQNGRVDSGETNPVLRDSDRDGLCDGYCVVDYSTRTGYSAPQDFVPQKQNKYVYWEDKNLNGKLDEKETDPLSVDTDGDGVLDDQEFYRCYITKEDNCS